MKTLKFAAPALAVVLLGTAGLSFAQGYPQPQPYPQQQQQGYPPQGQPGYGQDRDNRWEAPPQEMREFARQGFRDGIQGARRDMENHRRPNVNNRDEFRHPQVPRNVRDDYRMGFRRGYDMAVQRAAGGPGNGYGPPNRPY
ncbi:hypothetical protein SAMN05421771_1152 [Granulicella pectinivorans]|uniref:Uncharacterized protein n=1 Tax=Granulicella pectinivorans TaxID=474950 RepID=A0A1I6LRT4_9BACT|nr:hypothetical protein [Granulicella pectinivorans]SFS05982.1 hypothetical protein SAMN05421771_1152 [Granulicella pectinivorans]